MFLVFVQFIQAGLHLRQGNLIQIEAFQQEQASGFVKIRPITRRNDGNGIINM
jgi:hypothetical protein